MKASEAAERLKELSKGLTANSFEWKSRVLVIHSDGTRLDFAYAFARKEDGFIFVFTEHNGYHWFCEEDLSLFAEYKI